MLGDVVRKEEESTFKIHKDVRTICLIFIQATVCKLLEIYTVPSGCVTATEKLLPFIVC